MTDRLSLFAALGQSIGEHGIRFEGRAGETAKKIACGARRLRLLGIEEQLRVGGDQGRRFLFQVLFDVDLGDFFENVRPGRVY